MSGSDQELARDAGSSAPRFRVGDRISSTTDWAATEKPGIVVPVPENYPDRPAVVLDGRDEVFTVLPRMIRLVARAVYLDDQDVKAIQAALNEVRDDPFFDVRDEKRLEGILARAKRTTVSSEPAAATEKD
jgi:hypothetical protein